MKPSRPTFVEEILTPLSDILSGIGITDLYLAKKLKEELNAKELRFISTDTGRKVAAWAIRQRARQDAHKLRGDYPAEKTETDVKGDVTFRWEK
jgi:hypothetical protein